MAVYTDESELLTTGIVSIEGDEVAILDENNFLNSFLDNIAATLAVTGDDVLRRICNMIAHKAASKYGIYPASVQGLYTAMGKGEAKGFTLPALNIRTMTYETARMVFRCANETNASAFIFEIAISEIIYSRQRPMEYSSIILLAAIKEKYRGPVFFQGDHFQIKPAHYSKGLETGLKPIRDLIAEAINAGYYNIDIDSSTLVDLSCHSVEEQQKANFEICAYLTKFIRSIEPQDISISIGGEIGEVGAHNSNENELNAFMQGYLRNIGSLMGISKLSIQTGTTHGGIMLTDGTIAKVKLDFDTLSNLSQLAREKYALAGCVQHGASTLPNEAFHNFPEVGCAEIHLATQFQNIVFDYMPLALKEKIYSWLHDNCTAIRRIDETNDQFIYRTRKFALGVFKNEICLLSSDTRHRIAKVLKNEFDFLFEQLNIKNTRSLVEEYIDTTFISKTRNDFNRQECDLAAFEGVE